jgi:CRP-like cAMP-binding protein
MNEGQRRSRIVTMAAGAVFGEVALLDGKPRSATAVAAEGSVLYELSRDVLLNELATKHPATAMMLLATLSTELSLRLRETTGLLRRMDDAAG